MQEYLKATRSAHAYDFQPSSMANHFRERYVEPLPQKLEIVLHDIRARGNQIWALVPMAEQQPELADTVYQAAAYLSARLYREHVLFFDGGSCPEIVDAARAGGAIVLTQDRIFDAVDWSRLLPLLNLDRRPSGRAGQGFNVFAGHLALAALGVEADDVVFQCDADIQNYDALLPLERCVSVWVNEKELQHVKLAQPGRGNDILMAVRAVQRLWNALNLPWVPPNVKEFGQSVFMALAPDKWLTCGLYAVSGKIVRSRPFASGYLDATTQALWTINAPECGWRNVRHIECLIRCQDALNTTTKEALMMSSIALFLQGVVMYGKAPHLWNLTDIAKLNREVMLQLSDIPVIGDTHGPVTIHNVIQDRIIPSVNQLCEAGMVDLIAAKKNLTTSKTTHEAVAC